LQRTIPETSARADRPTIVSHCNKRIFLDASDQTLAALARVGDRAAFEQLVRRTGRLVFARLCLETGNPHEAEDLTQETFLAAFRAISQLDDPDNFRPWILSIAHRVHLDAVKNRNRKKRGQPSAMSTDLPDNAPGPVDHLEKNEQREKALHALRSLPEDYRLPLSMRYLAGSDYETIGKQLGLTNGSLRGFLHRGLEMLREKMSE